MSAKSYSAMNIKSEIKNYTNSFACRVQRKALKMDIAPWNQDLIHNNSKKTHTFAPVIEKQPYNGY